MVNDAVPKLKSFVQEVVYADHDYACCSATFVAAGLLFYILSIAIFQPSRAQEVENKTKPKQTDKKKKFGAIERVIFAHNLVLAVFSVLCFISTVPAVFTLYMGKGYMAGLCAFTTIFDDNVSTYGFWCYLFYLSKYWEFIDSWIVIARGRRPIWLQEYHHVGAVIGMWLVFVTKSAIGHMFVVQNSFIHAIMYSYYAACVAGYRFPLKSLITCCQIIQFVNGIAACAYHLWLFYFNGICVSFSDIVTHIYLLIYVVYLLYLFVQFYRKTYHSKKKKTN